MDLPVTARGCSQGQFYDLRELFREGGLIPETNDFFMGDYVDHSFYGTDTILLLAFKVGHPDGITLI
ncbi:hypothetical protein DBR06_SOUSAS1110039, partial [Sousa chinensis]